MLATTLGLLNGVLFRAAFICPCTILPCQHPSTPARGYARRTQSGRRLTQVYPSASYRDNTRHLSGWHAFIEQPRIERPDAKERGNLHWLKNVASSITYVILFNQTVGNRRRFFVPHRRFDIFNENSRNINYDVTCWFIKVFKTSSSPHCADVVNYGWVPFSDGRVPAANINRLITINAYLFN